MSDIPAPPKPTEPKDSYVTVSEIRQAWDNWLTFHRGIHCEETEDRFFNYCHSHEQSFVDDLIDWDFDEDDEIDGVKYGPQRHVAASTANRIKMLASTHSNTVLNAYYVKHPWK